MNALREFGYTPAERQLTTRFPAGYAEFVTQLGSGVYCGLVRVALPDQVVKENPEFLERIAEYYFWDKGRKVLSKDRALQCIRIGDTVQGDELDFHPDDPDHLYILPQESETVFAVGGSLNEALEWILTSGKLGPKRKLRAFDSQIGRKTNAMSFAAERPSVSSLREALLDLGLHQIVHEEKAGGEIFLEVYMPDLAGLVIVAGAPRDYALTVITGKPAKPAAVKRVLAALEPFGIYQVGKMPPAAAAKMEDRYFPLVEVLPSEGQVQDLSPEDVVRALIQAMNIWEIGMRKWHNDGHDGTKVAEPKFKVIAHALCDQPRFRLAYSHPPRFDPAKTKLKKAAVSGNAATVTAKLKDPFAKEQRFTLKRSATKGWRVTKVISIGGFGEERIM